MDEVRRLLEDSGALVYGHIIGTQDLHLTEYIAKDRALRDPDLALELGARIAVRFFSEDIEIVVGPTIAAALLAPWVARYLTILRRDRPQVLAIYAEPEEEVLYHHQRDRDECLIRLGPSKPFLTKKGERIILRRPKFVLKRGFDDDVRGNKVLVVEDTVTTGTTVRHTVEAVERAGGLVVGVGAIANGGNVTTAMCGVSRLEVLMKAERPLYTEAECRLHGPCSRNELVNTKYGHGAEFLARQQT